MIARLKARIGPVCLSAARKGDGAMIEDVFGVAALFALLFFALAMPAAL